MLTMSQINCIRDLSKQGYDISKIHTCTGVDRKTIRKYLEQDDFSPKPPVVKRRTSIVAPYQAFMNSLRCMPLLAPMFLVFLKPFRNYVYVCPNQARRLKFMTKRSLTE